MDSYGGERIGQGRENARVFLKENIAVRDKLEVALRKALGLLPVAQAGSSNGTAPAEKTASAEKPAPTAHAAAAGAAGAAARPRPTR